MLEFLEGSKEKGSRDTTIRPRGSGVASLLHWERPISLVSMLSVEDQTSFRNIFEPSAQELEMLPKTPVAFDSHCHLDRTAERL